MGGVIARAGCYSFTYSALDDALATFAQLARDTA